MIIMPDADLEKAADALMGAGYGSAGERCMAVSVAVPVGEATARPASIARSSKPRVEKPEGRALRRIKAAEMGPVVTQGGASDRVAGLLVDLRRRGGRDSSLVDGRGFRLQGYEDGFYRRRLAVRPRDGRDATSTRRRSSGRCCRWCAPRTYEDALSLPMDNHEYGNGVGDLHPRRRRGARLRGKRVDVGMVGVNVPVPGAAGLPQLRRLEALGAFGDSEPARPGFGIKLLDTKTKTVTARAGRAGIKDGAEFSDADDEVGSYLSLRGRGRRAAPGEGAFPG
jgi:malonate-semialdehyde dehydrogenase (acetylating)/methylmalonate-semialdehyde dehydrogenase